MLNKSHSLVITRGFRIVSGDTQKDLDVTPQYCSNPKCPCNEVTLHFHEPESNFRQRLFKVVLNLSTWELLSTELYADDADYPKIIHELVSDFSNGNNDEIIKVLLERKKEAGTTRYHLRNDIDYSKYKPQNLIFFSEIFEDTVRPQLVFEYNNNLYFATDNYCANPTCGCAEAFIGFQTITDGKALESPIVKFRVSFESAQGICEHRDENISAKTAQEMFDAFTEYVVEDVVDFCKERFLHMRKWGKTAFEKKVSPAKAALKIGRNDQCPCGSGKKYKKCCMNKEA